MGKYADPEAAIRSVLVYELDHKLDHAAQISSEIQAQAYGKALKQFRAEQKGQLAAPLALEERMFNIPSVDTLNRMLQEVKDIQKITAEILPDIKKGLLNAMHEKLTHEGLKAAESFADTQESRATQAQNDPQTREMLVERAKEGWLQHWKEEAKAKAASAQSSSGSSSALRGKPITGKSTSHR